VQVDGCLLGKKLKQPKTVGKTSTRLCMDRKHEATSDKV